MSTFRERRYGYGLPARAALARVVMLVAAIVAGIIVFGILLVVLGANQSNELVKGVTDAGRWLAGPFRDLFSLNGHKATIAVNWGIAAAVYLVVGRLIARLLVR
jgi:hypothetical protein